MRPSLHGNRDGREPAECPTPDKVKFFDRKGAQRHIDRTASLVLPGHRSVLSVSRKPYPCLCGFWHVTTNKQKQRKHC